MPLGGSRVSNRRWTINILIVFLISGLWHGANWTFVVWGALNGFYLIAEVWIAGKREAGLQPAASGVSRGMSFFKILGTYHLILLSWVFFRAESISQAWLYLSHMFGSLSHQPVREFLYFLNHAEGVSPFEFMLSLTVLGVLIAHDFDLPTRFLRSIQPFSLSVYGRPLSYAVLVVAILLLGVFNDGSQFIYFQF